MDQEIIAAAKVVGKLQNMGLTVPVAGGEGAQVCNDAGSKEHISSEILSSNLQHAEIQPDRQSGSAGDPNSVKPYICTSIYDAILCPVTRHCRM